MYQKCINKGMGKLGNWEMEGGSEALPAESRFQLEQQQVGIICFNQIQDKVFLVEQETL